MHYCVKSELDGIKIDAFKILTQLWPTPFTNVSERFVRVSPWKEMQVMVACLKNMGEDVTRGEKFLLGFKGRVAPGGMFVQCQM